MPSFRVYPSFRSAHLPLLLAFGALVLVSSPAVAQAECPNEQLRQENNSSDLPDCRAYEQVSPSEKEVGSGGVFDFDSSPQALQETPHPMQALADGSTIGFPGEPIFGVGTITKEQVEREGIFIVQYTATRSASAWNTEIGDAVTPEATPTPVLPSVAAGTSPEVLEETPDGSKVFFLDETDLVPGVSNAAAGEPDLYEYTVPSAALPLGQLNDLTIDNNAGEHANVRGILGVGGEGTEAGSYVYFVAGGLLAPHASGGGCAITNGETAGTGCNLYLRHADVTTFIATLSPTDEERFAFLGSGTKDWALPFDRTAEVSPNGRYVAFGSNYELNREPTEGPTAFPHGPEIFRYSADADELTCVSCSAGSSSEPDGPALPGGALNLVSTETGINGANRQRYMLDDGRVLFDTPSSLVPQDSNSRTDVYEWEPQGRGSCSTSTATRGSIFIPNESGCVSLISGGTSRVSQAVLTDASTNGSDVFFTTSAPLVPEDRDEIDDLYDAREGGGFPAPPAAACPTEADCRTGTPPAGPSPSATGSSTGAEPPPPPLSLEPEIGPAKALTRAQKLTDALRRCHKIKTTAKRRGCERQAKAKYAPEKQSKSKQKGSK